MLVVYSMTLLCDTTKADLHIFTGVILRTNFFDCQAVLEADFLAILCWPHILVQNAHL